MDDGGCIDCSLRGWSADEGDADERLQRRCVKMRRAICEVRGDAAGLRDAFTAERGKGAKWRDGDARLRAGECVRA